jgi:NDP-4-keto-2,6-dideoxyhexose 3-C-methyltransferase
MYKVISNCRICGEEQLSNVMSLGQQTLTGVFPKDKLAPITAGPVDLVRCSSASGCGLVQLKQSYNLNDMYGMNYGYRSGLNASMVAHLKSRIRKILDGNFLNEGDLIIDIGSNDATTLLAYPEDKYDLVGVDPTGVKFADYYPERIRLIPDFFTADSVRKILGNKKAKVITSFSMFYDLESPVDFSREIESVLADDGIWVFEQSYLPSMLLTNSFDTICQEHLEFYSLKQILWLTKKAGLRVIDVEFNDVNGGSFAVTACKINADHKSNDETISKIIEQENELGLESDKAFKDFRVRVEAEKDKLIQFLRKAKKEGKRVAGLGASTKGNVLLQYYGIDSQLLSSIGEVNEDKFGAYTPGTLIPLVSEAELLASDPDYLLVLPWHFRKFFEGLDSLKGRTLVFPLPNFEIVQL